MAYKRRYSRPPRSDIMSRMGIPWFTPENYPRIREIMLDKRALPLSYDQWRENAQNQKRDWERRNNLAVPVNVDPDKYLTFCAEHGFDPGGNFLDRFAEFYAIGKFL